MPREGGKQAKKTTGSRSSSKAKKPAADKVPSGARLSAAQANLRDSRMVARVAQGWTWEAIAAEAGISPSAAKRAVARRRQDAPLRLNMDPVEVIEKIAEGYQLSIGDFESIASAAADTHQLAVAVGAKKGANDAREKLLGLLQATGRLPQELGALRHLIDLRAIAVRMLDSMDEFDRDIRRILMIEDAAQRTAEAEAVAAKVRLTFDRLLGIDDQAEPEEDVPDVEGRELTA